ncbi:MAG: transposase [Trichodesmium sp. MAG_R01]|nr:transposase [Trichodesmium sp. MAG_R01]
MLYSSYHWRSLPQKLQPWQTISTKFRKCHGYGAWEQIIILYG